MKNAEAWQSYSDYTKDTSTYARAFNTLGVATCGWFLRSEGFGLRLFVAALLAFLSYFLADLAQYVVASERVRKWARSEEERHWNQSGTIEGEYVRPHTLDEWPRRLFYVKLAILALGVILLSVAIIRIA